MAVFDTMRHIRPDVSTVCVGLAASMGAFLLASGHQGKRYSLPNSRIMIHQPLGGAQGQAADIEIQVSGRAGGVGRGGLWAWVGEQGGGWRGGGGRPAGACPVAGWQVPQFGSRPQQAAGRSDGSA